jgi:hypothetical protein
MDEKLQRLLREAERAGYVVNFQKKSDLEHIVREWAELLVMRRQMQTLEAFCATLGRASAANTATFQVGPSSSRALSRVHAAGFGKNATTRCPGHYSTTQRPGY